MIRKGEVYIIGGNVYFGICGIFEVEAHACSRLMRFDFSMKNSL